MWQLQAVLCDSVPLKDQQTAFVRHGSGQCTHKNLCRETEVGSITDGKHTHGAINESCFHRAINQSNWATNIFCWIVKVKICFTMDLKLFAVQKPEWGMSCGSGPNSTEQGQKQMYHHSQFFPHFSCFTCLSLCTLDHGRGMSGSAFLKAKSASNELRNSWD